jgi:predicted ATPase/DNA-binding XRE family transcriptional regulator
MAMESTRATTFAAILRRLRWAAELSQEDLALRAGVAPPTVSSLERGINRRPHQHTIQALATALGLDGQERRTFEAAARRTGRGEVATVGFVPGETDTPLVGRAYELLLVKRLLAGEGPPVLLFAGEPGIGKSRLVADAAYGAARQGWTLFSGGCAWQSAQEAYAPLARALAEYVRRCARSKLLADMSGCDWLMRVLPELAIPRITPAPAGDLPPSQEQRLVTLAVRRFLANVAGPSGTVLLLDDLQWAGQDTFDLLASLLRLPAAAPLRMIGAYRPTEVSPEDPLAVLLADLARDRLVAQAQVSRLTPQEAAALLDALLGDRDASEVPLSAVESAARDRLLRRADGVPFFLVSYAQEVRAGTLASRDREEIPWDVRQVILQRVAALSVGARDVLHLAAVTGRVVAGTSLALLLEQPEHVLLAALEAACHAGLLMEQAGEYCFSHDLIREVVAADLGTARRQLLLRRVMESPREAGAPPKSPRPMEVSALRNAVSKTS